MANESFAQVSDQARVMALFKAGRSKVEIGREIGKDKKAVGNILAQAIRAKGAANAAR